MLNLIQQKKNSEIFQVEFDTQEYDVKEERAFMIQNDQMEDKALDQHFLSLDVQKQHSTQKCERFDVSPILKKGTTSPMRTPQLKDHKQQFCSIIQQSLYDINQNNECFKYLQDDNNDKNTQISKVKQNNGDDLKTAFQSTFNSSGYQQKSDLLSKTQRIKRSIVRQDIFDTTPKSVRSASFSSQDQKYLKSQLNSRRPSTKLNEEFFKNNLDDANKQSESPSNCNGMKSQILNKDNQSVNFMRREGKIEKESKSLNESPSKINFKVTESKQCFNRYRLQLLQNNNAFEKQQSNKKKSFSNQVSQNSCQIQSLNEMVKKCLIEGKKKYTINYQAKSLKIKEKLATRNDKQRIDKHLSIPHNQNDPKQEETVCVNQSGKRRSSIKGKEESRMKMFSLKQPSIDKDSQLKKDSILRLRESESEIGQHLSQFKQTDLRKEDFNVTSEQWNFEKNYSELEYGQRSLKQGVERVRRIPRASEMNNNAFNQIKKMRSGSVFLERQKLVFAHKMIHPPNTNMQAIKQYVSSQGVNTILQRYHIKMKNQPIQGNEETFHFLCQKLLNRHLENKKKNQSLSRSKLKVNTLVQQENKTPSLYEGDFSKEEDFFPITKQNIERTFKNFKKYQPSEFDNFYNIDNKNPYFRVYCDGQNKLLDKYMNRDSSERFFYQYDHDPFINDPLNYKIFDIIGQTYMSTTQTHPFVNKRRPAKDPKQLTKEVFKLYSSTPIQLQSNQNSHSLSSFSSNG